MPSNHCRYLIDWLSFTLKGFRSPDYGIKLLGLDHRREIKWQDMGGRYWYKRSKRYEGINIYYDGKDDMGICVEMTGAGCRTLETFSRKKWQKIIDLLHIGASFTRIDFAFDDYEGLLDMSKVWDDTLNQNFVSQHKSYTHHGGSGGYSVELGSRHSLTRIRIYDKAAEQGMTDDTHWVRAEMQLRDESAMAAVSYLASETEDTVGAKDTVNRFLDAKGAVIPGNKAHENIGPVFLGSLASRLRFVKPNTKDSNKRRWKTANYWENFIKTAENVKLFEDVGQDCTFEKTKRNTLNNRGMITAMLEVEGPEKFISELYGEIKENGRNPKYDEMVRRELLEKMEFYRSRLDMDGEKERLRCVYQGNKHPMTDAELEMLAGRQLGKYRAELDELKERYLSVFKQLPPDIQGKFPGGIRSSG